MPKYDLMTEDVCYKSYKSYEGYVNQEVKAGKLSREQARSLLLDSRKNYKNQNYNRQLEIVNAKSNY